MVVKKIDIQSAPALPGEVNFFSTDDTQEAIINVDDHEHMTLTPYTDPPYTFHAHTGTKTVDKNKIMLMFQVQMEVKDVLSTAIPIPVWRD